MSITSDLRTDLRAAKDLRMPGWLMVSVFLVGFACVRLLVHFGDRSLFLPIFNTIAILGFILVLKQRLWQHVWFWVTMAVIAVLHVPLILLVPWTTKWVGAPAIAVIDSVDFYLILWILAVVGKFIGSDTETSES